MTHSKRVIEVSLVKISFIEGWLGLGHQGRDSRALGTSSIWKGLPCLGVREQLWLSVQKLLVKLQCSRGTEEVGRMGLE